MSAIKPSDLDTLRQHLETRAAELHGEVDLARQESAEATTDERHNEVEDVGEQGEKRIRAAMRSAQEERDVFELQEIQAARQRMAAGSYGSCVSCGVGIPLARLQAQPAAARCIACQEAFEHGNVSAPHIRPVL